MKDLLSPLEFQVHYVHPHSSDLRLNCSEEKGPVIDCVKDCAKLWQLIKLICQYVAVDISKV